MVELFQTTKQNISLHIKNVYEEGELDEISTVKDYLTVQTEGKRKVQRNIATYNLDVVISVGYRNNSFEVISVKDLKNGVYIYHISLSNGMDKSGKLVILKQ